jgi:flavodoxin
MVMKPFLLYYSKTGNTKKIAQYMSAALRTNALDVKMVSTSDVPRDAFLIVGSGVYGSRVGKEMMDFLQSLPHVKSGHAATFETSGDGKEIVAGKEMGEMLEKRGYTVKASFVCPGRAFFVANRGHPSEDDIARASNFAKGLLPK